VASSVMPANLTFEGSTPGVFRRELTAAEAGFAKHASYLGLAVHHYDSYRSLMKGPMPAGSLLARPAAARSRY
jgi:hypothetical protein